MAKRATNQRFMASKADFAGLELLARHLQSRYKNKFAQGETIDEYGTGPHA
jgi:hypothetical protein